MTQIPAEYDVYLTATQTVKALALASSDQGAPLIVNVSQFAQNYGRNPLIRKSFMMKGSRQMPTYLLWDVLAWKMHQVDANTPAPHFFYTLRNELRRVADSLPAMQAALYYARSNAFAKSRFGKITHYDLAAILWRNLMWASHFRAHPAKDTAAECAQDVMVAFFLGAGDYGGAIPLYSALENERQKDYHSKLAGLRFFDPQIARNEQPRYWLRAWEIAPQHILNAREYDNVDPFAWGVGHYPEFGLHVERNGGKHTVTLYDGSKFTRGA
jgi:hypothetical protein